MKVIQLAAIFALATSASAWPLLTQDAHVALPGVTKDAHLGIYKEGNVNVQKTLKVGGPVDLTTFQVDDNAKLFLKDQPITVKDIHINLFDGLHVTPQWLSALSAANPGFPSIDAVKAAFPGDDFVDSFPTLGDVRSRFDLPVICLPEVTIKVDVSVCTDIGKRFPDFPSWNDITTRLADKLHHKAQKVYCLLEDIKHAFPEKRIPDVSELLNSLPELDKDDDLAILGNIPSLPALPSVGVPSISGVSSGFTQKVGNLRGNIPSVPAVPSLPSFADAVETKKDVVGQVVNAKVDAASEVVDAKHEIVGNVVDAKHEVVGEVVDAKVNAAQQVGHVAAEAVDAKKGFVGNVVGAKSDFASKLGSVSLPQADIKAKVNVQSNLRSKLANFRP